MAELWDDSALITAFNSAIAKYKMMNRVTGTSKVNEETASGKETFVSMESERNVAEATDEGEMASGEFLQREEAGQHESEVLEAKADELTSQTEGEPSGDFGRDDAPPASVYDGVYAASEYCSHRGIPASNDGCYMCQWNAYYNQLAAWSGSLPSYPPHGLQCQYCGSMNKSEDFTYQPLRGLDASKPTPDASAFPDMVRAAVAEAMKAGEGEKVTGESTNSSFSDVAVAWFMAGFHTSRYLSQGKGT